MTEKIETNLKVPKFKVNDRVIITKYTNIFTKDYMENWSREIFITDSVLKNVNGEMIVGSFYEKQLFLSKLYMSYCPEPDNHIKDKI